MGCLLNITLFGFAVGAAQTSSITETAAALPEPLDVLSEDIPNTLCYTLEDVKRLVRSLPAVPSPEEVRTVLLALPCLRRINKTDVSIAKSFSCKPELLS